MKIKEHYEAVTIIAAMAAVFISIASIYFSNKNAKAQMEYSRIQLEYNTISVQPILTSKVIFDSDYEFSGVGIKNKGLGPAIINNIKYYYSGSETDLPYGRGKNELYYNNMFEFEVLTKGDVVNKDEELWLIRTTSNNVENALMAYSFYRKQGLSVCYCSLYKQCTVIHMGLVEDKPFECSWK